jgi:alanine-glyoxylate transaminase/(R)-3-amino-2-methylpropionate-pyruvate transaminase
MTPSTPAAGSLIERRRRSSSPSLGTFPLFPADPLCLERGQGAHVWDTNGKRYLDCTAQNLCISLGYAHPVTVAMASEQMGRMQHCTTLFHHEQPVAYAEELVARMPEGSGDWVVHLVNSGAEAIDLAFMMARAHTDHFEMVSLRNAYHGLHFGAAGSTAFSPCRFATASLQGFVHAMHPDQYKGAFGPGAGIAPYLDELRRTIFSSTAGRIAGMIIERLLGISVGVAAGIEGPAHQPCHRRLLADALAIRPRKERRDRVLHHVADHLAIGSIEGIHRMKDVARVAGEPAGISH